MTRTECENQIIVKLKEIAEIYKQYYPKANYLSLAMILDDNYYYVNNNVKGDGEIDKFVFEKKEDEEDE